MKNEKTKPSTQFIDDYFKCKVCKHSLKSHNNVECCVIGCKCKIGVPYE